MSVHPVIVVAHAAFDPRRVAAMARLRAELEPQCQAAGVELFVYEDHEAKGSLGPWLRCLEYGASRLDATHVTFLSDDSILVPHFVDVLTAAIAARPDDVLCFQSNHPRALELGPDVAWYTTPDGFTAFAGTIPRPLVSEHLRWREHHIRAGVLVQGDEGVNLWAMDTGRAILKGLPSLVDHDTALPSCDGNDHHAELSPRRPLVFDPQADLRGRDWTTKPVALGRTYQGNHWRLAFDLDPWPIFAGQAARLDRMYDIERGEPVSSSPHVLIATPAYSPPELAYLATRDAVIRALNDAGVQVSILMTGGDSLVTRGRHVLVHEFLRSNATHLLQWDADVECLTPDAVLKMLATGHDVIGGAYPFRDGSGNVVANARPEDRTRGKVDIAGDGSLPVDDIGTGFLLTSRRVLLELQAAHPGLLYESDLAAYRGVPMWALFDTALEPTPSGRKRYASEDWRFCSLVRLIGRQVYAYAPAEFAHWGKTGHRGSLAQAWGEVAP